MRPRAVIAPVAAVCVGGCSGWQSALDPQGPQAEHLAWIIWLFTAVCTAVWVIVMIVLAVALVRRRALRDDPLRTLPETERRMDRVIAAAAALTGVIVIALTILSYASQRDLFAKEATPLQIRVIGHQWWWEVRYEHPQADQNFVTANEIHIPVGRPVTLRLETADVIHSFWVPSLAGKMDHINGQHNELQFVAARPGVYRGQCAEFCGFQHAHMAILVVAASAEEFEAWRAAQVRPAAAPGDAEQEHGRQVFQGKSCVMCHSIRGTPAGSLVGPDLTHLASRRTIAAGVFPLSRGNLAAWIADPQGIKPGANMPLTKLEPDELNALSAYLMSLK